MSALLSQLDRHPLFASAIGGVTTLSAAAVSLLQQLELILRVASVAVGLLIGLITLAMWIRRAVLSFRARLAFEREEERRTREFAEDELPWNQR